MILTPPENNSFQILNFSLHYYSICIFFAILSGLCVIIWANKKFKLGLLQSVILDFSPSLIIISILGARLYYVLLSFNYFFNNPAQAFMIWKGGIAIHGAFLAGLIYGIWYFKKKKLDFFPYADVFCLALPLGQAIGRFGNFFNSEAFGIPVSENSLFALFIKQGLRPAQYMDYNYFCPVFLYESFFDFLIFLFLLFLTAKFAKKTMQVDKNNAGLAPFVRTGGKQAPHGAIFFTYIFLYSIIRAVLEFLRVDTIFYIYNIPFPALVSFAGIIAGLLGLCIILAKK